MLLSLRWSKLKTVNLQLSSILPQFIPRFSLGVHCKVKQPIAFVKMVSFVHMQDWSVAEHDDAFRTVVKQSAWRQDQ